MFCDMNPKVNKSKDYDKVVCIWFFLSSSSHSIIRGKTLSLHFFPFDSNLSSSGHLCPYSNLPIYSNWVEKFIKTPLQIKGDSNPLLKFISNQNLTHGSFFQIRTSIGELHNEALYTNSLSIWVQGFEMDLVVI